MEQVFFRLHVRLIRFVTPLLVPRVRKLLEKFVLMNAILSLCLLVWLHMMYVNSPESSPSNCLYQELVKKNMIENVGQFDVIKLHISNDWLSQFNHESSNTDRRRKCASDQQCDISENDGGNEKVPLLFDSFISSIGMHIADSQHSAAKSNGRGGGSARLFSVAERFLSSPGPATSTSTSSSNTETVTNTEKNEKSDDHLKVEVTTLETSELSTKEASRLNENIEGSREKGIEKGEKGREKGREKQSTPTTEMASILLDLFVSQRVYLFSLEKGYLMLHPDERDRHDIKRLDVTIARDSKCFGPSSSAWLVHSFIGYDTVVMNWAISTFGGKGYLYNIYSKELFNLNFAADFVDKSGAAPVLNQNINLNLNSNINLNSNSNSNLNSNSNVMKKNYSNNDTSNDIINSAHNNNDKSKELDWKKKDSKNSVNNKYSQNDREETKEPFLRRMFSWLSSLTQRTRGGRLVQFTVAGLSHFISFKIGVIFSTLFLFFTTTTLVSFTLRETQERMLKFTFLLQHHVSHRIPYASLVFTHVVESLVFVPIMVSYNVN